MDISSIDAVKSGKCAVERFWGQTLIYMPFDVGQRIGEKIILDIARKLFEPKGLRYPYETGDFDWEGVHFYCVTLPSVLDPTQDDNPNYELPRSFLERILEILK